MKMEIGIMAGAESKKFLADFKTQIDRLESLLGRTKNMAGGTSDDELESDNTDESEITEDTGEVDFSDSTGDDSDDSTDLEFGESDDTEIEETQEEEEAPKKVATKKPGKPDIKDVNAACQALAKVITFAKTQELLSKHFKIKTISKLAPEKYPVVIKFMQGALEKAKAAKAAKANATKSKKKA